MTVMRYIFLDEISQVFFCVSLPLKNQIKKFIFLYFSDHLLWFLNNNSWELIIKNTVALPIEIEKISMALPKRKTADTVRIANDKKTAGSYR